MSSSHSFLIFIFFGLPILFIVVGGFRLIVAKFDQNAYQKSFCTVSQASFVNISAEICSGGGFSGANLNCQKHQGYTPSWTVFYNVVRNAIETKNISAIINSTYFYANEEEAFEEANFMHRVGRSYRCVYHREKIRQVFWILPKLHLSKDMFLFVTGIIMVLCFSLIWGLCYCFALFRKRELSSSKSYRSVTIINSV